MFLFLKKEIYSQDYKRKENIMKKLVFVSMSFLSVFSLMSFQKLRASNIEEIKMDKKSYRKMNLEELTYDEAVEDIMNGVFVPDKHYLEVLQSEEDNEFLPYAYQFIGQSYLHLGDYPRAAKSYFLSLQQDSNNWELKQFLLKLKVTDFSEESIYKALTKIKKH